MRESLSEDGDSKAQPKIAASNGGCNNKAWNGGRIIINKMVALEHDGTAATKDEREKKGYEKREKR